MERLGADHFQEYTELSTTELVPAPEFKPIPDSMVVAVDVGSTNVKVEVWTYQSGAWVNQEFHLADDELHSEDKTRFWRDYQTEIIELEDDRKIRCLRGRDLEGLVVMIESVLEIELNHYPDFDKTMVFTGFTNSLALIYEGEVVVLLDEPSLTTEYLDDQQQVVAGHVGQSLASKIPTKACALTKLLAIRNDPRILATLFGREVDIKKLQFSSMLGLLEHRVVQGMEERYALPLADLASLAIADPAKISGLIRDLGLPLLEFYGSRTSVFEGLGAVGSEVISDFTAEVVMLQILQEKEIIGKNALAVAVDSVGKIVSPNGELRSEKGKEDSYYLTQRMTGNINKTWMRMLLAHRVGEGDDFYHVVDGFLREFIDGVGQSDFVYYPVRNGRGYLYRRNGNGYRRVHYSEAEKLQDQEKEEVALAVAAGAMFGLRQKIDCFYEQNEREVGELYFYGGLVGDSNNGGQVGWRNLITRVMSQARGVSRLKLPSAASAAALVSLKEQGSDSTQLVQSLTVEVIEMEAEQSLESEYQNWLAMQQQVIEQIGEFGLDEWGTLLKIEDIEMMAS